MEQNDVDQHQPNLKNDHLSVVVSLDSWLEAKTMLEEGADVNLLDSDGNTPLHIAVNKGYADIVKLLLMNKANINILNEKNESALDIAARLETSNNNNRIIMDLQDYVLEQSFEILEEYVENQESLLHKIKTDLDRTRREDEDIKEAENFSNRCEYSNSDIKKLNNGYESLNSRPESLNRRPESMYFTSNTAGNETTDFVSQNKDKKRVSENPNCVADEFVNRKNTPKNIEYLFNEKYKYILREIKVIEQDIKSFHGVLCDLKEAFENDDPLLTYCQANIFLLFLNKFIFINLIAKNPDFTKQSLFDDYLSNYYLDFKRDLEVLATMSKVISNNSCKKFTLEDISKYFCLRSDKTTILKSLSEYIDFLCAKIDSVFSSDSRVDTNSATFLPNLMHRTEEDLACIGIQHQDILKEELANLIKAVYVQKEWTVDRVNEILFSFLVNISSGGRSNGPSGLKELREKVISKYHTYKNVPIVMKLEFERATFVLRSILFKYYLAKEVFAIMYTVNAEEDIKQMEEKLRQSWLTIEEEFKETYKILTPGSQETSFYDYCFQSSVSSVNEDLALKEFIELYLKFLIIIDTPKIEKQYQIQRQFDFYDLGEELEKFMDLKLLKIGSPLLYAKEKEELRKDLRKNFVTQGRYLEEVCQLYIESPDCPRAEIQFEDEIRKTISTIRKLQSTHCISNKEILFLYSRVLELNNEDDMEKIKDLIKKIDLTNSNAAQLVTEMGKLFNRKKIEISLCGDPARRDTVSIISNVIITFSNLCKSYQIKFNNLEEAFLDNKFLNNLLREAAVKRMNEPMFDPYFPCKIHLELKYTVPYFTSLIIEKEALQKLERKIC